MLRITINLLNGSYRADPDGSGTRAEWPPAPSRILDALIDAGNGPSGPGWDALRALYAEPPPVIYATTRVVEQHSVANYAPTQARARPSHATASVPEVQGMAGRTTLLVAPSPKVVVADSDVVFVWPDTELSHSDINGLSHRAARVGYVGCSDSKAVLTIGAGPTSGALDASKCWRPTPTGEAAEGDVLVNVGSPQHLAAALRAHKLASAPDRRRARQRRTRVLYRPPGVLPPPRHGAGSTVWLQFDASLPGTAATHVAYALKAALMRRWKEDAPGGAPWWVSGHDIPATGDYQLARFLVLPAVGHRYSDGRLHGACVWIPPQADPAERDTATDLAVTLGEFYVAHLGRVAVSETAASDRRPRWAADPRRWKGPASAWVTALPALNDRHGFPTGDDVARWCRQAGLPAPRHESIFVSRRPTVSGGVELRTHHVARPGHRATRGFAHVCFTLEEPVEGPVAVGAGRSYGLGLCAPGLPPDHER